MRSGTVEPTLRWRFFGACLGLAGLLIGGFALAIHQFVEVLEHEIIDIQFRGDFVRYAEAWLADRDHAPTLPAGLDLRFIEHSALASLPPALRELAPGIHDEVAVAGKLYAVGRRDLADGSLYLLLDSRFNPIERLEDHIVDIAMVALAAAALLATAAALWLARIVLGPVERLAASAARIEPGAPRAPLAGHARAREIVQIADAFDRTLDRFDELVDSERAFARDASHELRTPLAVILSGIELLERQGTVEPRTAARLARLRAAAEQMQALTEGLLFLARPDPRQAPVPGYAASDAIRDALRVQRLACLPRTPDLTLEVRHEHVLTVPRGLLLCVVGNLLRNAVEHAGAERVETALDVDGLTVTDHGRGLDAQALSTIFEPHRRGAASGGEGLGLSIVLRICARLGWPIEVTSTPGAGTRFHLGLSAGSP